MKPATCFLVVGFNLNIWTSDDETLVGEPQEPSILSGNPKPSKKGKRKKAKRRKGPYPWEIVDHEKIRTEVNQVKQHEFWISQNS